MSRCCCGMGTAVKGFVGVDGMDMDMERARRADSWMDICRAESSVRLRTGQSQGKVRAGQGKATSDHVLRALATWVGVELKFGESNLVVSCHSSKWVRCRFRDLGLTIP